MRTLVKFCVGNAHPLFGRFVLADVKFGLGYNGKCVEATTCDPVHYPEDPEGLFVYEDDKFSHYETRPAYDEVWTGWVEALDIDGHIVSAKECAEYIEYLRLKKKFEGKIVLYSNDEKGGIRTPEVYAHGILEDEMRHDYITASEKLTDGAKCEWHGKPCTCYMWLYKGAIERGLVCYDDDLEAIGYCKAMRSMCA